METKEETKEEKILRRASEAGGSLGDLGINAAKKLMKKALNEDE